MTSYWKFITNKLWNWLQCSLLVLFACIATNDNANATEYKTVYVSSSCGNDNNIGTEEHPFKTIRKAGNGKRFIRLRLKRGDVFYENMSGYTNCIIESYGKGARPIVCGFRVLWDTSVWQRVNEDVWRLNLNSDALIGYKSDSNIGNGNIGCIYDYLNDSIIGKLVKDKSLLKDDDDFYTTNLYKKADIKEDTFGFLYLKSSQNPAKLGHLCFSAGATGISRMENCTIRDISVIGFGCHGMAGLNNTKVQNCNIDIIGGSILCGYKYWVRYGNGIEFYINANKTIGNSTITDCTISRTYDCGSTIQGGSETVCVHGIKFKNNVYRYCGQGWEFWQGKDNECVVYEDCEFSGNILYKTGQNAFSGHRRQNAHFLCYDAKNRYMKMTKNVCYGGDYYFGKVAYKGLSNNEVYLYSDNYISSDWTNGATNKSSDKKPYKKWSGDNSRFHILHKGSIEDESIRKKIETKIHYERPQLNINFK